VQGGAELLEVATALRSTSSRTDGSPFRSWVTVFRSDATVPMPAPPRVPPDWRPLRSPSAPVRRSSNVIRFSGPSFVASFAFSHAISSSSAARCCRTAARSSAFPEVSAAAAAATSAAEIDCRIFDGSGFVDVDPGADPDVGGVALPESPPFFCFTFTQRRAPQ
jgi:hypothetical protein